jgi:class 3 adenylate cyclase/tetratricopeptide (TPR) repeat protein
VRCASCAFDNEAGNRFCEECGSPLASTCPSCGEPTRADARFCRSCGHALSAQALAAKDRSAAPAATAERRLVSVLFTDLVGFTTLAEDRDPETVRELLSRYFDTATEIVSLHGGTVEKFIGDAVMAVWGTPVAHEDDAERAVRAALEMVDAVRALHPDLHARAGVLTGDAAVTLNATNQGMVAGDLVNTAARLQGVAEPGTVLVGEATMRAAERAIVFEALGSHSLKGKTTPIPAWHALRVVARSGGQQRADTLEPPFVGRDEELRQLKEVLHAVGRENRTRLVSITGPGGIGKSRLVWELEKYVDGLTDAIWWHRGRSPSYGEGITFWALGEMIRWRAQLTEDDDEATTRARIQATLEEHVPDADERQHIGPALLTLLGLEAAPAGGREALFPAWRLLFERIAENGTTVLVFEDLQWADPGLLDFLDHLLDWSRGLPIMVVTLARPELYDRRPDWGAGRRHLTALALQPLTDDAVGDLLHGLVPGLPESALATIVARAEGIPLYAVEMVRGLLADGRIERRGDACVPVGDLAEITVPDSLRSLIASRLDALDPADRSLLQEAAVLGQVFSAEALAAVNGTSSHELEPRLRALVRREVLDIERDPDSPERGQFKFVQSLIREVAYGTLSRRDRRARHLAVARHYESLGDEELAGALASHYLAARAASDEGAEADALTAQARLALSAAAERAAGLGSPEQAVRYLDQALEITSQPRDRALLLDRAAEAASVAAAPDAQHYAEAAVAAYRDLGERGAAAGAMARLGRILLDASEVGRATEALERALAEAEAVDDEPVVASTLATLSRAYMRSGLMEQTLQAADRALPIAERLNLDDIVAEGLAYRGTALSILGRRREAIALQRAALEITQRLGLHGVDMRMRNNLSAVMREDQPSEASQLVREALEVARKIGDRGMYNWLVASLGAWVADQGRDWEGTVALLRDALESATLRGDRLRLRYSLGVFEMARGEGLEELRADVADLVGDSVDPEDLVMLHTTISGTALAAGDLETAYRRAIDAHALHAQNLEMALSHAMRAAILARDAGRARIVAGHVDGLAGTGAWTQATRAYATAAVAALEGHRADALVGFRGARDQLKPLGNDFEAASRDVDALWVLSDEPEVRSWAAEVRPLLEELRARPLLEQLDAALAGSTDQPSRTASPGRAAERAPG